VIADYTGSVDDAPSLARRLSDMPGVVEHGLFAPSMVSDVLVGRGEEVEQITVAH
jgi:ribose 5-phosphate isomerase A